jgi:hypothetical protein
MYPMVEVTTTAAATTTMRRRLERQSHNYGPY